MKLLRLLQVTWGITFIVPGMHKWLHRKDFRDKIPSDTLHKFSEEKWQQFIEYDKNLNVSAGDKSILFLDAAHPTQATKITYGWVRKGYEKPVKTTGNRTRLNILGALNLSNIGKAVIIISPYFSMKYVIITLIIVEKFILSSMVRVITMPS